MVFVLLQIKYAEGSFAAETQFFANLQKGTCQEEDSKKSSSPKGKPNYFYWKKCLYNISGFIRL